MAVDLGTMALHGPAGEEVFYLQSATFRAFRRDDTIELFFQVDGVSSSVNPNATLIEADFRRSAEVSVFLREFDAAALPCRFEVPCSYDDVIEESVSRLFFRGCQQDFQQIVVELLTRKGEKFHVRWSGTTDDRDYRDGSKIRKRVVIEGMFEFLGVKPMFQQITAQTSFIKPFPPFEEVFTEPISQHRKHFLPLLSVDASVIDDDLDFWIHFVTPIEPLLEGNVGDWTATHHDFYNAEGQVSLQFVGGKYSFTGDFNFFAYESGAIFEGFPNREEEIHEDYRSRITSYEAASSFFQQYGRIPWCAEPPLDPTRRSGPLMSQFGGKMAFTNFGELPRNRSGKLFRYIGEIQGFSYCHRSADAILLFYDPDERIALLRFDWT
jgi:hypothetical protein